MSKVVVISGGSDGLGYAIAKRLTKNNIVIILSPHEDKLKKVSEELKCEYFVCDVSQYDQDEKVIKDILEKHGKIDVLINNAGLWIEDELDSNDPEGIRQVIEVNTFLYPGKMKTKMFEKMGIEKSMEDALDPMEVAKTIEFILSLDQTTVFPEIGLKHSGYKYNNK